MVNKRNLLISGIGLAVLAVVFIATLDWESGKDRSTRGVVVRGPEPATVTDLPPAPEPAMAPKSTEPAESTQPAIAEHTLPQVVTYDIAEAAYLERRYDEAVELFSRYTEKKSENPWGFYMLGLSAWKAGDLDKAETAFVQAIELDSSHVKSYINLSRVLLDAERSEEAMTRIDEALAVDPQSSDAYRLKGRAFYQMGDRINAEQAYRQAIEIDHQDAWSMNNLALVLIDEQRFDEALPPLARAVELRGDVAIFQNNLGMVLERLGHFQAAQDAYEVAVTLDRTYEKASLNLDRLSQVDKEPDLEPVDLAVVAQNFADTIERWTVAAEATAQPEWIEMDTDSLVVSKASVTEADSTEHR
jgi:Flp pilus assembly protein TadD